MYIIWQCRFSHFRRRGRVSRAPPGARPRARQRGAPLCEDGSRRRTSRPGVVVVAVVVVVVVVVAVVAVVVGSSGSSSSSSSSSR